jgi:Ca2+-binding RTX toxin-like protein
LDGHAQDSDAIAGDNANIFRLVGTGGTSNAAFLIFNYDDYDAATIIPRAVQLLDDTPGGSDLDTASASADQGAADEIHGESGDDFIHGMVGADILFGDGQDDDLIGGYGPDWISDGTGQDGVLGDDGRVYTSRNTTDGEPLYGIAGFANNRLDQTISTPGNIQQATINVGGELKKTVNLTPFNVDPNAGSQDLLFVPTDADDIIFGGLGSDFLHGGPGDDAISGAEALALKYPDNAGDPLEYFFDNPGNPGDYLRFGVK